MTVAPADTDAVSVITVPAFIDVTEVPPEVTVKDVVVAVWEHANIHADRMIEKKSALHS